MRSFPLRGLLAAVPACLLLAGCDAQNAAAPTAGAIRPAQITVGPVAERNFVYLCKDGTDASFNYSVGGVPSSISLVNGECQQIASHAGGRLAVNVTEVIPANTVLDSITMSEIFGRTDDPVGTITNTTVTGTASVSTWVGLEYGAVITYFNRATPPPPPPGGGEGCTPGYWKQSQHFDSWPAPYTPNTLFSSVFENAFPGKTLVQVAGTGGGGLNALGRHTVAALLNGASAGVDYDLTAQDVIDAFNAVFPGGDYEGQKNIFEGFNEQGCPLN